MPDSKKIKQLVEMWRHLLFVAYRTGIIEKIDRFGLTFIQRNVIIYVARHKRIGMSELGRILTLKGPALTRITDVLEKKKLLKRIKVPGDRRGYSLTVTDSCRKILNKLDTLPVSVAEKLIKGFTKEELDRHMKSANIMKSKLTELLQHM